MKTTFFKHIGLVIVLVLTLSVSALAQTNQRNSTVKPFSPIVLKEKVWQYHITNTPSLLYKHNRLLVVKQQYQATSATFDVKLEELRLKRELQGISRGARDYPSIDQYKGRMIIPQHYTLELRNLYSKRVALEAEQKKLTTELQLVRLQFENKLKQ